MARPITLRRMPPNLLRQKLLPGQAVEESMPFFTAPEGEDYVTPLSALGLNRSPFVQNLRLDLNGLYRTRHGTEVVSSVAASQICGLAVFSSIWGNDYIVRVTTTGVDIWSGTSWTALTGPALAISPYTIVEFSVWGSTLMFTDGATGLYSIAIASGAYTQIVGATVGKHLTTFGGRAVVSYVTQDADTSLPGTFPTRIEWSVKNNNEDWIGLGSGYEDLLSAPGGTVDIQHGVIPVTDVEAFVIRSSSIWIMNTTGLFDTPYQFTYRFDQGTDSPHSIVRVPAGINTSPGSLYAQVIMLGTDDVVIVKPEGIYPIDFPIRDQLLNNLLNTKAAIAGLEPRMREYWLHVPPLTDDNDDSIVWKYSIDKQKWTHALYPFKITRMAFKDILASQTFDELTGTFDSLVGPFDSLGQGARQPGAIFAITNDDYVVREREGVTGDVTGQGVPTGIAIEIRTGEILPASPLEDLTLIMVQLLYEATQAVVIDFEYSSDGGTSWTTYGQLTLAATAGPEIVPYRYTLFKRKMQLRAKSSDGSTLKFHGLFVKTVRGAAINQ